MEPQADPVIRQAAEACQKEAAELKRKHEREQTYILLEHKLKLAKLARDQAEPPKKGWFQRG